MGHKGCLFSPTILYFSYLSKGSVCFQDLVIFFESCFWQVVTVRWSLELNSMHDFLFSFLFLFICSGDRFSFMIKNMSILTSSMSVEKQFMPENRVQQVELLNSINDLHGGVVVNIEQPMDSRVFSPLLRASISQWRQQVYIVCFNLISYLLTSNIHLM